MVRHERKIASCLFCISADELMWGESEKEGVMSRFPLLSSLLCICPRAAIHPHHLNTDGTLCLLSCWFSHSPLFYSFLFICSLAFTICHTSWCNLCLHLLHTLHLARLGSAIFFLPFLAIFLFSEYFLCMNQPCDYHYGSLHCHIKYLSLIFIRKCKHHELI